MKENYQYREQAVGLMSGKYSVVIFTSLILAIFVGVFQALSESFAPVIERNWQTFEFIVVDQGNPGLQRLFNILAFAAAAIVAYATIKMYVMISNQEVVQMEDILKVGFVEQPLRSILFSFVSSIFIFLWTLLLIIPGIMASYAYSMGYYLMYKEQDLQAMDAIKKSKSLMMGRRMQLFLLDLSYLGWYILGIFTLGILWFWIFPKHQTAKVLFFNDVYGVTTSDKQAPTSVQETGLLD